ncbi:unnamed protein product [Dibothriocephalus latus]|uniref:Small monomeric GTPase n=1 Tax=Dibothriocephalus latus TaxID=60516 RepID=A0A3P6T7M1_DIBLA|nr:unnamed protein product [Dibothriocephalus latus]
MTNSDKDARADLFFGDGSDSLSRGSDGGVSGQGRDPTKSACRVVFLGAAKVGKSSIIHRFLRRNFEEKYVPTIDDVYPAKFIVRNCLAQLEFMDTSGSYDFPAMIRLCIAKADAFVIVFANDSIESLHTAGHYLDQIKSEREDYAPLVSETRFQDGSVSPTNSLFVASPPPLVVVCNKSDIPVSSAEVSEGMIMEWLLKSGLKPSQFVYASAKTEEYLVDILKALWSQNEVTRAVSFPPWAEQRRGSSANVFNELVCAGIPNANGGSGGGGGAGGYGGSGGMRMPSSAPVDRFLQHQQQQQQQNNSQGQQQGQSSSPTYELSGKRSSFFRNSLKLRRRNSSRTRKANSEIIHLDCVIS